MAVPVLLLHGSGTLMAKIIRYDTTTRDQFCDKAQAILDRIKTQYPVVEIEQLDDSPESKWFVQIYRKGSEGNPEGFFGDTSLEAAQRLAKALKIET